MLPPDAYYDAALRWFDGASSLALARALIDATTDERSLWLRFEGFGLADLLMSESDATERARIVAGVARAAGQQLFTGPLFAGSSIGVGARKADGSLSGWQDQAETAYGTRDCSDFRRKRGPGWGRNRFGEKLAHPARLNVTNGTAASVTWGRPAASRRNRPLPIMA